MTKIALKFIDLYKKISPFWVRGGCRYYPSCSEYASGAFRKFGFVKGLFLASKRLITCNQFFPGGFDPVPDN